MQDEERPPDRPLLVLSVLGICVSGFVVQLVSLVYLFQGLCNKVPDNRTYCMNNTNDSSDDNNITEPLGETYFSSYQGSVIFALIVDFMAFVLASCRVFCCAKHCCVKIAPWLWEQCNCCGHCWYFMVGLSVFVNLIGLITVSIGISFGDLIKYQTGFQIAFGNLLFGFFKIIGWSVYSYKRRSCCPDREYFLGSSTKLSDCYIKTTRVTTRVTRTRSRGGTERVSREEVDRRVVGTRRVQ